MTTITEALSEINTLKTENERLTQTLSSAIVENANLRQILRAVKSTEVLQAKIDLKTADIQAAVGQKAGLYTKPISDAEKAELAGMHQRNIEALQVKKLVMEQDKAALDALIVPV